MLLECAEAMPSIYPPPPPHTQNCYQGRCCTWKDVQDLFVVRLQHPNLAAADGTDVHIPQLTVKQTLEFAFECQHKGDSKAHAEMIMKALGLSHVADTVVGAVL